MKDVKNIIESIWALLGRHWIYSLIIAVIISLGLFGWIVSNLGHNFLSAKEISNMEILREAKTLQRAMTKEIQFLITKKGNETKVNVLKNDLSRLNLCIDECAEGEEGGCAKLYPAIKKFTQDLSGKYAFLLRY